jgi:hypothetical protein
MPIAPAITAALISAAAAATTTGLEAAGTFQPSTTKATQEAALKSQQDQQKQAQTMEQAMFKHYAPDAQAQSGGALGDQSLSALISELAGTQGGVSEAQQTIFGSQTPSPGQPEQLPQTGMGLSSTAIG